MKETLSRRELQQLVTRVFHPRPEDRALGIMIDLPDQDCPDHSTWEARREMAAGWAQSLRATGEALGLRISLCVYRNAHANNADLPEDCWIVDPSDVPNDAARLPREESIGFDHFFREHSLLMAVTEFSATAPLKLNAKGYGFRAATMGGFSPEMIPALRLDYREINRRVELLKRLLDESAAARIEFVVDGQDYPLFLDLRHRWAHASGGLFPDPGTAGNLPSGESYIVPYEGEKPGDPSRSRGLMPVQFGADVVVYEIRENRAVAVKGEGEAVAIEAEKLKAEPAYGNIAELGLGVLDDFGVQPCGSILLDEKLGLHVAFGRSDHFGGIIGPSDFSHPDAVVHIDRVYVPSMQPRVQVKIVKLEQEGQTLDLMANGKYLIDF